MSPALLLTKKQCRAGESLRKIETPVDQGLSETAGIRQEHANLAILDPSRRAGILAGNTHRVRALLHEPRLVDNQNPVLVPKRLDHVGAHAIPQSIGLPETAPQQ